MVTYRLSLRIVYINGTSTLQYAAGHHPSNYYLPPVPTFSIEMNQSVHVHDSKESHRQEDHDDHQYIVARMDKYAEAYQSGQWEKLHGFYDPNNCFYQDFHTDTPGVGYEGFRERFERLYDSFADFTVETLSVQGHKGFVAWEWSATGKLLLDLETGGILEKVDAPLRRMLGCTLMWWENDKVIKSHDYMHQKPV
ncbi:hypothetical protein FB567DRAFT_182796 [Paraphoma chrysanthemicola]|uniref:SnoaL-like domain-containing protein n=1 Tax=Paraphoma chrysanthemicola TaxID=798071 RepID=A0A8K0VTM7_9PLEO|nr:hypothetical protein FB567DRAFT_182796 [Paraphoma chrysanthemicola]